MQGTVLIMGNITRNGNTWQSGFHHLLVFFKGLFLKDCGWSALRVRVSFAMLLTKKQNKKNRSV
jgi:hypothetical protein